MKFVINIKDRNWTAAKLIFNPDSSIFIQYSEAEIFSFEFLKSCIFKVNMIKIISDKFIQIKSFSSWAVHDDEMMQNLSSVFAV